MLFTILKQLGCAPGNIVRQAKEDRQTGHLNVLQSIDIDVSHCSICSHVLNVTSITLPLSPSICC